MPKMKTKSGAKKRFKMTGTGKVVAAQAGKRHGMIKRTAKFIQKARGTGVLNDSRTRRSSRNTCRTPVSRAGLRLDEVIQPAHGSHRNLETHS